jgi:uncharacterized protein YkwD
MRWRARSDTAIVALGRRVHSAIRRHSFRLSTAALLLALCACCGVLAGGANAARTTPSARVAASYTSHPPSGRHRGCARRASYHAGSRGTKGGGCGSRHRAKRRQRRATPPASGACADTQLRPNATNLTLIRAATLCLVNRERARHGEQPLRPNADLLASAQAHSADMASGDYFAHDSLSGSTPLARMRAAGYIYSARLGYAVGENIAWATLWLATPRAIVAAWMSDPGHRANILDATFRDTGIGVSPHPIASLARGEAGAIYTQDFGRIILP